MGEEAPSAALGASEESDLTALLTEPFAKREGAGVNNDEPQVLHSDWLALGLNDKGIVLGDEEDLLPMQEVKSGRAGWP